MTSISDVQLYIQKTYTSDGVIVRSNGSNFIVVGIPPTFRQLTYFVSDLYSKYQATVVSFSEEGHPALKIELPMYYKNNSMIKPPVPNYEQMATIQTELLSKSDQTNKLYQFSNAQLLLILMLLFFAVYLGTPQHFFLRFQDWFTAPEPPPLVYVKP